MQTFTQKGRYLPYCEFHILLFHRTVFKDGEVFILGATWVILDRVPVERTFAIFQLGRMLREIKESSVSFAYLHEAKIPSDVTEGRLFYARISERIFYYFLM